MAKIVGKQIIEGAIKELLYEYDNVILPKLGGFVKQYKPASFDYVQGKITPPSTTLTFNENLVTDDGILVDYYQKKTGLPIDITKKHISEYVENCSASLKRKEVVSIPEVGRIMKDYEMKSKFISHQLNFNTDTFGLPEINYYPIQRNLPKQEDKIVETFNDVNPMPSASSSFNSEKALRIGVPIALAFLVVLTGFLIFNSNEADLLTDEATKEASKLPVNISPSESSDDSIYADEEVKENIEENIVKEETTVEEEIKVEPKIEKEIKPVIVEETKPVAPKKNTVSGFSKKIIYVGLFSKQKGVDITTANIVSKDFIPYTQKTKKGLTRVGIRVPAGQDPNDLLLEVQSKINPKAYLK